MTTFGSTEAWWEGGRAGFSVQLTVMQFPSCWKGSAATFVGFGPHHVYSFDSTQADATSFGRQIARIAAREHW